MKKLIQSILLIASIILISGCDVNNLQIPTSQPVINASLPVVDAESIKTISDMTDIAFEWKGSSDASVQGYHIYRSDMLQEGEHLRRVDTVKNRYVSHYIDDDLKPDTQYLYAVSTVGKNGTESVASQSVAVKTNPIFPSVSFITAIDQLPRQIKVLWRPHTSERVKKYIIQRNETNDLKWKNIETVSPRLQAEYIDTKLGDSEEYSYRIISVTFDGIKSLPSKEVKGRTKPLPLSVSNINASQDLPEKIILTWEPLENTEDLLYYTIYSSHSSNGIFYRLAQAKLTDNTFEDKIDDDGEERFYKITTMDKYNLESSKEVSATMGKTLDNPARPVIDLAMIKGNEVIINWQAGDNRTVAYNIHKTVKESFFSMENTIIPNVTDVRFEDKDITRGITYEYSIEAIDKYGLLSEKTPPTSLTIPELEKVDNASPANN